MTHGVCKPHPSGRPRVTPPCDNASMSKTATVERVEARDLREGDRVLEPVAGRIHDVWRAGTVTFNLRGERVELLHGCPVLRHKRPQP